MDTDSITIPLRLLLDELYHSTYKDRGSISPELADILLEHEQHDKLFHVEKELLSGGYMLWSIEAWNKYVECDYSWSTYVDKFFAERKQKALLNDTNTFERKTTNINKRIKALEDKDPFGGALLRGLFKDL